MGCDKLALTKFSISQKKATFFFLYRIYFFIEDSSGAVTMPEKGKREKTRKEKNKIIFLFSLVDPCHTSNFYTQRNIKIFR